MPCCTDWLRGIVVIISITQILNVWSISPHGWLISQVFMYVNITSPIERVFNQPGAKMAHFDQPGERGNIIWVFPTKNRGIETPQNGWFIKMENPMKIHDLGGNTAIFGLTPILEQLCSRMHPSFRSTTYRHFFSGISLYIQTPLRYFQTPKHPLRRKAFRGSNHLLTRYDWRILDVMYKDMGVSKNRGI